MYGRMQAESAGASYRESEKQRDIGVSWTAVIISLVRLFPFPTTLLIPRENLTISDYLVGQHFQWS